MDKVCKQCSVSKPVEEFYWVSKGGYRRGNCKTCHKTNVRERLGRNNYPQKKTKVCADCDTLISKHAARCFPCAMNYKRSSKEFTLHPSGYMMRGPIREHRVIMEEHLGRKLLPGETVHHKNGVRHDNRLENLELWVVHQPSGQRVEDLLDWADEILRRYRA